MTDAAEFDWATDDSVALLMQPAIAVYTNRHGQVIIRRERSWDEEDDRFIHIASENVVTIVGAILRAADMEDVRLYRENGMACYDIDLPSRSQATIVARPDIDWHAAQRDFDASSADGAPQDRTAAERQRRHRSEQPSKGVTVTEQERDNDRDTVRASQSFHLVAAE